MWHTLHLLHPCSLNMLLHKKFEQRKQALGPTICLVWSKRKSLKESACNCSSTFQSGINSY